MYSRIFDRPAGAPKCGQLNGSAAGTRGTQNGSAGCMSRAGQRDRGGGRSGACMEKSWASNGVGASAQNYSKRMVSLPPGGGRSATAISAVVPAMRIRTQTAQNLG